MWAMAEASRAATRICRRRKTCATAFASSQRQAFDEMRAALASI